jgi:hypothetical protein
MATSTKTHYRIRGITRDGQIVYSAGGAWPLWSRTGKTWTSTRALNDHLAIAKRRYTDLQVNDGWNIEVATIAVTEVVTGFEDVTVLIGAQKANRAERLRRSQEAAERRIEERVVISTLSFKTSTEKS